MEEDPGLPIKFGPCSNAEYDPDPLTPTMREAVRRARADCETNARRAGMSRRQFLLSLCGTATTLMALNACTRESSKREPGGRFEVSPEATLDEDAARESLAGDEFVFDIQGHLLEYDLNPSAQNAEGENFWSLFPQQNCGADDPRDC